MKTLNPIQPKLIFGQVLLVPQNNIGKNNNYIYNFRNDGSEVDHGLRKSILSVLEGKADADIFEEI